MNALNFTRALLLTVLLLIHVFASSVKLFFTSDELEEMGIRIGPSEMEPKWASGGPSKDSC